ncbi:DUF7285 family protein [Halorubrum halodurans]|uniref:Uncharacterized protein n=1 Tax=Halorubrum halodurans TaxID=1383851 RepID=A0A256IPS1_9EURY|nr:hypothetical protein [Halorubrum halodurans]OYR58544.1 hypothetical protein DJ70_02825 [Halorubrum halodurans]
MSRSSGERLGEADRAAVEPLVALVAVLAIGAGLGLYVTALDGATPEPEDPVDGADAVLDRIERDATVGGIVRPDRLRHLEDETPAVVELETERRRWRVGVGTASPFAGGRIDPRSSAVAGRSVTVAVAPGENVRGRLRVAIRR